MVDIGYKSEGMIPADQFLPEELEQLAVNDPVQVYIEQCEDADGNCSSPKKKNRQDEGLGGFGSCSQDEKQVQGKVISRIKGGMIVDIGVKAFCQDRKLT